MVAGRPSGRAGARSRGAGGPEPVRDERAPGKRAVAWAMGGSYPPEEMTLRIHEAKADTRV